MNKLLSKLNWQTSAVLTAVLVSAVVLAPRVGNVSRAQDCPNPPQVATLNPYPVSESGEGCTDRPVVAVSTNGASSWTNSVSANYGEEVYVRVYVHNGAAQNIGATANNVSVRSSVSGNQIDVQASGSNTNTISGRASVNLPAGATMEVEPGSATVMDWQLNVLSGGQNPSYVSLGEQEACFEFARYVTFIVKVSAQPIAQNPTGTISATLGGQVSGQCLYTGTVTWSTQNSSSAQVYVDDLDDNQAASLHSGELNGTSQTPWLTPGHAYLYTLLGPGGAELSRATVDVPQLSCGGPVQNPTGTISATLGGQVSGQCLYTGTVTWSTQNVTSAKVFVSDITTGVANELSRETSGTSDTPWLTPGHHYLFVLNNYPSSGGSSELARATLDVPSLNCGGPAPVTGSVTAAVGAQLSGQCLFTGTVQWSSTGTDSVQLYVDDLDDNLPASLHSGELSGFSQTPWLTPAHRYVYVLYNTTSGQSEIARSSTITVPQGNCGGPVPVQLTCSPTTQNVAVYQAAYLSATGGTGSYSWSAPGSSNGSGSGSSFQTSYGTAGSKSVTVTSGNQTATCNVAVQNPIQPQQLACSPSTQTVAINQAAYLSATGGTGSYSWTASGANTGSGFGSAFQTSYGTAGSKSVTVTSGNQTATCAVAVETQGPAACVNTTFNPSTSGFFNQSGSKVSQLNPGQAFTIRCDYGVVTGSITLMGNGANACRYDSWNGTAANFNCTAPLNAGTFQAACVLSNYPNTDNLCAKTNDLGSYSVNQPQTPTLSCSPNTQNVSVSQTAYLSATGGTGTYSWSAPGASNGSGFGSSFQTSYGDGGSKSVTVTSGNQTATCTVQVQTPNIPTLTCSPSTQTAGIQGNVYFSATGGTGTYSWSAPGANQPNGSGSSYFTAYGTSGSKTVTVTSGNQTATCNATITEPQQQTLICTPGTQTVGVNQSASFSATGGSGSYSWSAPGSLNQSSFGSSFSTSYTSGGSRSVTVTSGSQTATCNVTVTQPQVEDVICSPSSQSAAPGQIVYFTASRGNGSYSWQASGGSPSTGTSGSFFTTFGDEGAKTVTVSSAGRTASCSVQVTRPVVNQVICSPAFQSVEVNQPVYFSATNGSGSYSWSASGGNTVSGSGSSFHTSYSTSGTRQVTVTSAGLSSSCTVEVRATTPICTPNTNMHLSQGAFTQQGSTYSVPVSWSFSGQNAVRVTYVDPADNQEKTLTASATAGGTATLSGIQPNVNYIVRLYDTASCGGLRDTMVVRKDFNQICTANTNAVLSATSPVKDGSSYRSTVNWTTSGSHGMKLTQGNLTNVVATGSNTGSFPVTGMQAGSSYTFYLIDAECGTLLSAVTISVPTETTGGGSNYFNYQNCVYNSCNTTNTTYIFNNQNVPASDYRALTVLKNVRRLDGGSFTTSVTAVSGETVEFQIRVRNSGNATVNNVRLTDNLPSGLTLVGGTVRLDGSQSSDGSLQGGQLYLGNLTVGQERTLTFQARVNSGYGSSLQNVATASGDSVGTVQDDAWVFTQGVAGGNVNLQYSKRATNETKNADATAVVANKEDFITYTLTVYNSGNQPATNFTVTDDLSQVLPYADVTDMGGGSVSGNTITFPGITVPANGSVSRSFRVRVKYFLADNLSYVMTNTYGNTLTVRINTPRVQGAFIAPKTGADTAALGFGGLSSVGYALWRRRRDLGKLSDLILGS